MFAAERLRLIKGILMDKKHINVSSLSSMLDVSEVTVRRDLEKLEKENFLTRTHGGAIINDYNLQDGNDDEEINVDNDPYYEERIEISRIASHMIEDNDVILLTPGLTNLYIARKILGKRNITVLTNDLNIASELAANAALNIIVPGGDLDSSSMVLTGKLTEENIRSFYVSKAFIEVEGVSLERGYTLQSIDKASVIREMINITREKIIVCPYQCYDNIAFYQIAHLDMPNKVVTNPPIPDQYKNFFFDNNIQLFTAFNSYEGGN